MSEDAPTQRLQPEKKPQVRALTAGERVFGRFVVEVIVGRGGMGVVWRANDETLGETVALKFLPETVVRDAVAVDELKAETRRTRRLAHPHIVRVHDFMQDNEHAAVSMEFVAGSTLAQLRLEQPGKVFGPETLAPLVAQLCAALDYAHFSAKVVHRDLKPANILVTPDGVAKISDFGIARSLSETHTRLTGSIVGTSGTLLYMSPQQLLGKKIQPADDIYALGATLYELLTGKPPFYTGDITHQVLQEIPAGLAAQRAELGMEGGPIPRQWEETILACLAKDPAQRPASAGEVANRLGLPGAGPTHPSASPLPKPDVTPPPAPLVDPRPVAPDPKVLPRKFLWPYLSAALLALLVIGGVAYYLKVYVPTRDRNLLIKHIVEDEDRTAIVARIDRLEVGAPPEQRDATEMAVKAYLASAPVKYSGEIQNRWAQRLVDWDGPRRKAEQEQAARRAEQKAGDEKKDFDILAAKIDALSDRPSPAQRDLVEAQVKAYMAVAPEKDAAKIQSHWTQRLTEWEAGRSTGTRGRETAVAEAAFVAGTVQVDSLPAGAAVYSDGRDLGTTPWHGDLAPADYEFELRLRGYRAARLTGTVESGKQTHLSTTLKAEAGTIRPRVLVRGQPVDLTDLRYLVDGREAKLVNGLIDGLAPGEHQVEALHLDYTEMSMKVIISDQVISPVEVALVPKPATLTLAVSGPSDFTLLVNGQVTAIADHQVTLPAAEQLTLVVLAPGYKLMQRIVTLPPNGKQTLAVILDPVEPAPEKIPIQPVVVVPESRAALVETSPLATTALAPPYGKPHVIADLGLQLLPVAIGTFTIGSPTGEFGRALNEGPQTGVTLSRPFWLGKYEVTQSQWQTVMGSNPSHFSKANAPVEEVSWNDALEFCRKLTERERAAGRLPAGCIFTLPTEAQWEYACRAGTTTAFAGNLDHMSWYKKNSADHESAISDTVRVHSSMGIGDSGPARFATISLEREPNAWGFYDMHGNVAEWCFDWYGDYPGGNLTDPTGPAAGANRVYRGGAWNSAEEGSRSAARYSEDPGRRESFIGFRCALVFLPAGIDAPRP